MKYFQYNNAHFRFFIFVICALLQLKAYAQKTPDEFVEIYKNKYPKNEFICLNFNQSITIEPIKDSFEIKVTAIEEFLYLTKNPGAFGERSVGSTSFLELTNIEAYTENDVNGKYKKFKVNNFKESTLGVSSSFYDDFSETSFRFDNIGRGSKSYLKTVHELKDKHFLPLVRITPHLTFEKFEFSISAPLNVTLQLDTFNFKNLKYQYTDVTKGNKNIHTWIVTESESIKREDNAPDSDYYGPVISVRIASIEQNGKVIRVLKDLDDLFRWYSTFAEASINLDDPLIKSLSDSIVGNEKDELEKAKKIYRWVQQNIRYIAIEDGYNGFIPAAANQVCNDRFGDCKGMSNLLFHLLAQQNLDAHLAWVGTRARPFKYNELPGPAVDNHMITYLKIDNKDYFLDATHANLPFHLPSPFTQGKETLVYYSPEKYEVKEIPKVSPTENLIVDSCYISIVNRDLIGSGVTKVHGYQKMFLIDNVREKNYEFVKNYARGYLQKGSNKFVIDSVWFNQLEDPNKELVIGYTFKIPDYLVQNKTDFYINPNLDRANAINKINKDNKLPTELEYKIQLNSIFYFELPNNLKLNYKPKSTKLEESLMSFDNNIKDENGILKVNNSIQYNTLMVEPNEITTFNSYLGEYIKSLNYSIELLGSEPK